MNPQPLLVAKRRQTEPSATCSFLIPVEGRVMSPSVGIPHATELGSDLPALRQGDAQPAGRQNEVKGSSEWSQLLPKDIVGASVLRCAVCDQGLSPSSCYEFPAVAFPVLDFLAKVHGWRLALSKTTTNTSAKSSGSLDWPRFCHDCFSAVHKLRLCWTCGGTITRFEEQVGCDWAWWHWGCVACTTCRAPVPPPPWQSPSRLTSVIAFDNDADPTPQELSCGRGPGYIIPADDPPTCRTCRRSRTHLATTKPQNIPTRPMIAQADGPAPTVELSKTVHCSDNSEPLAKRPHSDSPRVRVVSASNQALLHRWQRLSPEHQFQRQRRVQQHRQRQSHAQKHLAQKRQVRYEMDRKGSGFFEQHDPKTHLRRIASRDGVPSHRVLSFEKMSSCKVFDMERWLSTNVARMILSK